jgi:hypothetical protein
MDDTSRDLFLSPESLECHPPRMDSRWWGIYTLTSYLEFPCGTNTIAPGTQQRPLLAGGPPFLPFLSLSYDLSLIINIYL